MLISKKWLQSYFDTELPSMKKIADTLLLHSFEIEGLEEINNDWILDIDVLPNRAHDCLSYLGIAQELAGLLNLELRENRYSSFEFLESSEEKISINIENTNQCLRYIGVMVKNIEIHESPEWLKNRMQAMGQKSINALVDATNYIMFDIGQPMHVFDADKVSGGISVRNAKEGETIITLSGEELELLKTDLVIADDEKILALAGVKGGNAAEVNADTKNIIIEAANFNPLTTRKTARRVKITTDAGKRYENALSSEKALRGIKSMLSLLRELSTTDTTTIGQISDIYPKPEEAFILEFTQEHTARLLGFDISEVEINEILERFHYPYIIVTDGRYNVTIPFERLDLRISADMIEEIGRLYGYHNIPTKNLDTYEFTAEINPRFYIAQKLRSYFIENGFTEIMNYTFVNKGNVEVFNPVAKDKKALRKNLSKQMIFSLEKNAKLADFVAVDQILNFEIDIVHTQKGEEFMCCFGIDTLSKKSRKKYGNEDAQVKMHLENIAKLFNKNEIIFEKEGKTISFNLEQCEQKIPHSYGDILLPITYSPTALFTGISIYQHMKRDISFWATEHDISIFEKAIKNTGAEYLKKVFLFDEFEKDGRTSYAFSMIFQSNKKTLTDAEVDVDMKKITTAIENLGGEVR